MSQEYDKMMRQFADKYRHVCVANNSIDAKLFEQYGVKRGLRDKNGKWRIIWYYKYFVDQSNRRDRGWTYYSM